MTKTDSGTHLLCPDYADVGSSSLSRRNHGPTESATTVASCPSAMETSQRPRSVAFIRIRIRTCCDFIRYLLLPVPRDPFSEPAARRVARSLLVKSWRWTNDLLGYITVVVKLTRACSTRAIRSSAILYAHQLENSAKSHANNRRSRSWDGCPLRAGELIFQGSTLIQSD
ncbi:hypothetical protein NUW54_g13563 [Trametes sanguinea]|uniref:Uncharacterized protein n=1 Tax=Trametes sanguinea TaxID=158606 RepID=A0ACC1MKN8_9APHY|nr:hypothetical protein NUW54_g13563 [Trametes sanguinea]